MSQNFGQILFKIIAKGTIYANPFQINLVTSKILSKIFLQFSCLLNIYYENMQQCTCHRLRDLREFLKW